MSKAFLKVGESGRFAVTSDVKPVCGLCGGLLHAKGWVFWCEVSKELFCEECMKQGGRWSRQPWACSRLEKAHQDFYCVLEIKQEVKVK